MVALAERDLGVVGLRMAPAWLLVELGLWMGPAWLLNLSLDVGDPVLAAPAERNLMVVALAWFLVELGLWMDPAWLLAPGSYLYVEGLGLVLVALILLAEWGLDLGLAPCPGFGLIYA